MAEPEEWRPGSFTKNFSWGAPSEGLRQLHEIIRVGFDSKVQDVARTTFRNRVKDIGRPDYIAINFFLFNKIINGVDHLTADELVFQAVNFPHSEDFDRLGLFAFNLSMVGNWKGAYRYQSRPALWAHHYVVDRVSRELNWDTTKVNADDIEAFVRNDPRYTGKTSRKLATNLSYLYRQGGLSKLNDSHVSRWWDSALFLTLDRLIEDRIQRGDNATASRFLNMLDKSRFHFISGRRSVEKDLATKHLLRLYEACGGRSRFSEKEVRARQMVLLPEIHFYANNPEPIGALHPTNYRIVKTLPRACAMLALYCAGFVSFDVEELDQMDIEGFIRDKTKEALQKLKAADVRPTMSAEELLRITRGS